MRWNPVLTPEGYKYIVESSRPEASPLEQAIERVYDWARDQAFLGSGLGDRNTNAVYNDVVRLIIESPASESGDGVLSQIDQLRETLQTLSIRSKEYSRFGLVTPLNLEHMMLALSQLEEVTPDKVRIVYNVLKPFAEGIDARLKALESIHDTLQTFMDTLKLFYKNKLFSFKVREGLRITAKKTNQRLDPKMLSSGEKQILLLFCNTIAAKDQATIFIIDEPEISLNVKWQRQLVQALLDCVRSSPIQFILATHSIELLARHRHNVVPLKNLKE
jgi:ABC-type dipeptide/oligopeptide/nickel transport system ATPase component